MDGLEIRSESPQEDEFALLTLGADSAYRAFLMPHRIRELTFTLEQKHWLDEPQWLPIWEDFLRGVLRSQAGSAQPLILKSPNHTYRLQAILKRFPRSRIIWMARSAADTFHSNFKMWNAMFAIHGLTKPDNAGLDSFLSQAMHKGAHTFEWCRRHLSPEQFVVVPHATLQQSPRQTTVSLCRQLRIETRLHEIELSQAILRLGNSRIDTYGGYLSPTALAATAALDEVQRSNLEHHGLRLTQHASGAR